MKSRNTHMPQMVLSAPSTLPPPEPGRCSWSCTPSCGGSSSRASSGNAARSSGAALATGLPGAAGPRLPLAKAARQHERPCRYPALRCCCFVVYMCSCDRLEEWGGVLPGCTARPPGQFPYTAHKSHEDGVKMWLPQASKQAHTCTTNCKAACPTALVDWWLWRPSLSMADEPPSGAARPRACQAPTRPHMLQRQHNCQVTCP